MRLDPHTPLNEDFDGLVDFAAISFLFRRGYLNLLDIKEPRVISVVLLISWHILVQIIWHTPSFLAVPADPGKRLKLHIALEYAFPKPFHTRFATGAPNNKLRSVPDNARSNTQQMRDLAVHKGVHHMVGLQARGAGECNRVRDLVAEGYVGKVLSCTMIITTPTWGTEFTRDWAYMADRSNGNTLMSSPGGHAIDALCYSLGEFKELSSVVANQRQQVKIVETGETIQMNAPDQVLVSGILQSGAVASIHLKGGTVSGTGFLFEIHGTEGALAIVPADPSRATYIQVSEFSVRGAQAGKPLADLSIPERYRWVPPAVRAGLPFNVAQLYRRMADGIREGRSVSPDFDVAVKLHQLLDAIQKASDTGSRQIL
jgi:predicted dehydrogenase